MIINCTVPTEVQVFGPDTQQRGQTAQGASEMSLTTRLDAARA